MGGGEGAGANAVTMKGEDQTHPVSKFGREKPPFLSAQTVRIQRVPAPLLPRGRGETEVDGDSSSSALDTAKSPHHFICS